MIGLLKQEDVMRLSAAATEVGKNAIEASKAFSMFCGCVAKAAISILGVADIVERYSQPTDEALKKVATDKEWHLMKNAKKHRTRKKYKNRLIKRYHQKI